MKNKNYIKDDGIVRNCTANVSKMTPLELVYYEIFQWKFFTQMFYRLWDAFKELLEAGCYFFSGILVLILFPIILPISAYNRIKQEKKYMKKF